jgi:hypothetical protein
MYDLHHPVVHHHWHLLDHIEDIDDIDIIDIFNMIKEV